MFLKKKIYNIFFSILFYLILIISYFKKIRFLQIETRRFGHMCEPIEIHFLEKKKFKENFKDYLDIYFPEKVISNTYLWRRWKNFFKIKVNDQILRFFCEPIFKMAVKKKMNKLLIPFRHNSKVLSGANKKGNIWQTHDINNVLSSFNPIINFSKDEKIFAEKIFKNKNISKNDKIILLTIRDDEYYKRIYNSKEQNDHRNTNINIFLDLIKYLCDKNFKVIRMGKIQKNKIKFEHPNFFDYAFSDIRNDFFDIYLFSISTFVISNGTGLDSTATLFRKKILYLNYGELTSFNTFFNNNVAFIYPRKFVYREKEDLNIIQIFDKKITTFTNNQEFQENDIKCKDLNANEQIQATVEMINFLKSGYTKENIDLNNKLFKVLKKKFNQKIKFNFSTNFLKQNELYFN
jgi:putative glycosyltransferase (TIGR04372 family)